MKARTYFLILIFAGVSAGASPVFGQPFVPLGPSDNLSLDQPRVAVEVFDPGPPVHSFGPEFFNTFLLDTGATGLIAVGLAVDEMVAEGYQTEAVYDEQGIAGTTPFDVSAVYEFHFAGTSGIRNILEGVRILSNADLSFGGFLGIVGTPAMVSRVTTVDMTPMAQLALIGVEFSDSIASGNGRRYSVPLSFVEFPTSGQRDPNDPLPTFAPLPFTDVHVRHAGQAAGGMFVVDTGAQVTMLSSPVAFALGLDANDNGTLDDEALYFMPVGGVGGEVWLPVLAVERLALPTDQGVDLVWTDLEVLVGDVDESIQGIFGMDLLTSGWLDVLFGYSDSGYIQQAYFDFRDAANLTGTMHLDIDPDLDDVWIPGDANHDGAVDVGDLGILGANWGKTGVGWSEADFNGDTMVNVGDLAIFGVYWGYGTGGGAGIPEPATVVLFALPGICLLRRRGKR